MKTFKINKRAQDAPYKHIEAKPLEIEHYGRKHEHCRKNEAIDKICRNYENFVLYGIGGLIRAA